MSLVLNTQCIGHWNTDFLTQKIEELEYSISFILISLVYVYDFMLLGLTSLYLASDVFFFFTALQEMKWPVLSGSISRIRWLIISLMLMWSYTSFIFSRMKIAFNNDVFLSFILYEIAHSSLCGVGHQVLWPRPSLSWWDWWQSYSWKCRSNSQVCFYLMYVEFLF